MSVDIEQAIDATPVDIVLVDDHPLLIEGLRAGAARRDLVLVAPSSLAHDDVAAFIEAVTPLVVVLDHQMPPHGVSTPLISRLVGHGHKVMVLTATIDDALWGSLLAEGAAAVIGKDEAIDEVLDCMERVGRGEMVRPALAAAQREAWAERSAINADAEGRFAALTPRERAVASRLVAGTALKDIAAESFVSVATVRSQLKSIFRKVGVSSQLELVTLARDTGWRGTVTSPDGLVR